MFKKLKEKAYTMGVQDGLRWSFHRMWGRECIFEEYYRPPFFFKKLYGQGFDDGAKLEKEEC